jgi:hypothetical protein
MDDMYVKDAAPSKKKVHCTPPPSGARLCSIASTKRKHIVYSDDEVDENADRVFGNGASLPKPTVSVHHIA